MSTVQEQYDEAIQTAEKGDVTSAVEQLTALAEAEPDYVLAHAALARFYSKLENHEKAVEHAEKVCQLEPEDPFSYVAKSIVCVEAGDRAGAEDARAQALRLQWQQQMADAEKKDESEEE